MLYTDRPASSFWANYVPPEEQLDVHELTGTPLPAEYRDRLKKKVVQYINENNVPDITTDDIVWYGIRDWGREPYGAANHAWRPERKYWVVMRRLADIARPGRDKPSIHVCGEAYSDYHGFIEGSLRSAVYVLHRILDKRANGPLEQLPWLSDKMAAATGTPLPVDTKYLHELRPVCVVLLK
jgi:monoamine oxidase